MKRIINLKCHCGFHKIVIEKFHINKINNALSISIYMQKSTKTKKLLADVVLATKEIKKLKKYLK